MAPKGSSGKKPYIHEVERTAEYDEFIKKLQAFHEKRGTNFEPEPRLQTMYGHVTVDLLQLYKAVIQKGGYDELNKVQKSWGALATELGMHFDDNKGLGQLSFQLKQDFYRYLGAFWIHDQHGKEPPPKDILEDQSCATKHGPILTRTRETFQGPVKSKGEETPAKDERPSESTPASGNRASGRLREAPPQRVPFQPETGPSRTTTRHAPSQHATPTATSSHASQLPQTQHAQPQTSQRHDASGSMHLGGMPPVPRGPSSSFMPPNSENASRLPEAIEPRPPMTVALRPVNTPGNNPVEFAKRQRQLKIASGTAEPVAATRPYLPGAGSEGPNVYMRCLMSLRSGIPAEQTFALYHLVKISFERGDKYKFEHFHGLAEGLVEKALEVGSLFYHVNWQIAYFDDESADPGALDGINGTSDILKRIERLTPKVVLDHMQSAEFSDQLARITEAVLTIRNMVITLPENAEFMVQVYPLRDLLCIILHLPNLEILVELKHFALEIAEQLTPHLELNSGDPLYQSLLDQLKSSDRGTILTALRAASRISMNSDTPNKLQNVPPKILQNIMNWLMLNDEELMDACLDFLYQYTAVVLNVESLLHSVNMERLVPNLVRLLAHGAKRVKEERVLVPETKIAASEQVAALPQDLQEKLTRTEEPQRCFQWLQSLFEEDSESHITQIAIWQAYQGSFGSNRNYLSAADFIRNVSHVFNNARAQIIRGPGEAQRFIIEGIRARAVPLDHETKEEYSQCQWTESNATSTKKCGKFMHGGEKMWRHILEAHLGQKVHEDGKFGNAEVEISCQWATCLKYSSPTKVPLSELARHLKTHLPSQTFQKRALPDASEALAKRQRKMNIVPAKTMTLTWENTLTTRDDRRPQLEQAAGIPLSAVLVLRNIARNVVKTESEELLLKKEETGGERGGWNEKLFRPVMARLFEVMTENKVLADYIASLLQLVQSRSRQ